ncbi:hypothetical protein [Cohaesibacter gelatinilyticus]|uniref:Uncharacterized protein n=1 Tax=Cohaesibacter gelatinilyticus TaxID=372072 RepID=A0A285PE41_9HYPH|nr:hypothetical protein [Cohaesibacter gelatinilyticus]SNZ19513.1 hypothetical protein SAMN06265368_2602 [Cohaesibacter gelatinilyticus]
MFPRFITKSIHAYLDYPVALIPTRGKNDPYDRTFRALWQGADAALVWLTKR